MADRLDPRVEYSQPVVERGPDGKPILVQYGKSGERMIVQGAQPKREFQTLNLGGVTKMVDTSELAGPQDFTHTMTPGEVASNRIAQANLGVAQQRLNLDQNAYDIKEGPDGFVYVPKVPGQGRAALPVMTPGGVQVQPAKEAPADFSKTSKKLSDLEGNLKAYKAEVESDKVVFPSQVPLPLGASIPLPTGEDTARMRGRYQALLMGVKDLYELGALTGPDMGIVSDQITNPASFAGVFTSRNAMKEQIGVLENMLGRAKENLSTTYKRPLPASSTSGLDALKPQPKSSRPARLVYDPVSKNYRYVQE
jgi:hypothetical protein